MAAEFCVFLKIPGAEKTTKVAFVCAKHFDYYPAQVGPWVHGIRKVGTLVLCDCCARGER